MKKTKKSKQKKIKTVSKKKEKVLKKKYVKDCKLVITPAKKKAKKKEK